MAQEGQRTVAVVGKATQEGKAQGRAQEVVRGSADLM